MAEENNKLEGFVDIPITSSGAYVDPRLAPEEDAEELSWSESLKVGGTDTWLSTIISDNLSRQNFVADENFQWTGEKVEKFTTGLSDSYLDYVMDAKSDEEAAYRQAYATERQQIEQTLANSGWSKNLAAGVVSALDPIEIGAVTAATAGLGTIPRTIAKLGKAVDKAVDAAEVAADVKRANAIRKATNVKRGFGIGAVEGMATVAPFELVRNHYLPQWNDDDMALVLAISGGLGSTVRGAMSYFDKMKLVALYQKRTADGAPPLSNAENELFRDVIEGDALVQQMNRLDNIIKDGDDSLQLPDFDTLDTYDDATYQRGTNWGALGLRKTLSTMARAMGSEDGRIRELASRLGLNSAGNKDGSAVRFGALEQHQVIQNTSTARLLPQWQKLRKSWMDRTYGKMSVGKNAEAVVEFNEKVAMSVRGVQGLGAEVDAAADLWRKEAKILVGDFKKSKARGYKELEHDDSYVPRIIEDNKFDSVQRAIAAAGGDIVDLVKEAIRRAQPDLEDDLLAQMAEGYVSGVNKRMQMNLYERTSKRMMGIYEDTLEDVRLGLVEKYGEDGANDIIARIDNVMPSSAKQGGISRVRQRVDLDEMASITLPNGQTFRFTDILNNDLENLHQMYAYQMGGAIALARNGIDREGMESFDSILDRMLGETATDGKAARLKEKEIEALRFMHDGITGKLAHMQSDIVSENGEKWLRRLREFNFIRIMGATGIPTMVEAAATVFEHGAKSVFQGVPRMRSIIKKAADGNLEDPLFREMMHLTGEGIDMFTGRVRTYFDDMETDLVRSDYTKMDYYLAKARNVTATLSGMLPMTVMFRRADTMFYAYDWFNAAMRKGGYKQPFQNIKMEQLGISPEDGALIAEQIKKHAVKDKNGKLVHMNTDAWDARARDLFALSAKRHSSQSVQETNISSVNRFLRSPVGKTVFQFLSYVTAAQEQQFQRHAARLANGDIARSSTVLLTGSFMATLAYVTGVQYRAQGMSESKKRKYLKDRLSPDRIFVDGTIGYLGALSFQSTLMQQVREGTMLQNPSVEFVKSTQELIGSGVRLAQGDDLTEREVRSLFKILPFQSFYPIGMAANALSDKIAN